MEPVITSIVAAIVAGAVAASKDVATSAIKDSYSALKSIIVQRYEPATIATQNIEKDPNDKLEQAVLAKRLNETGADTDQELQGLAIAVLDAVSELKKDAKAAPLFDFQSLKVARDMKLTNIDSIGQIMQAEEVNIGQDFIADNIVSRSKGYNDPKK
ncbi:hypothetical protein [Roseibium sp.]|uniref:hypothetical protein n=1 Tax=Roseibium sp. TaxID=1936156 RepID=UPI003BADB708